MTELRAKYLVKVYQRESDREGLGLRYSYEELSHGSEEFEVFYHDFSEGRTWSERYYLKPEEL